VPVVLFLKKLGLGLLALGMRRLFALALAGVTVFVLVGISGYYLSRPVREVLYSGLDPQDVSRIGAVLEDSGIAFDVNVTGDTVLVDYGQTAKARMILAQKGLPKSDDSGYELFDKLGSLGLTSFMQQVTRVRALEGELARTIQGLDGVKAARVHLALRNEGSFRNAGEQPTASVVIRGESGDAAISAQAIRHLVAAAIPGLSPDQVTVMSTDGTLLSSTGDAVSAAPEKIIGLERTMASDVQQKVERTLAPYLGLDNFRISVSAKLNADRKQINETNFDPNSRVERSVRSIKESGEAQNASGAPPVSVLQNVPQEASPTAAGDNSREKKDRREELTNYEINSKSIATTTEGYGIDQISIAIVINKAQLIKSLGDTQTPEALAAQLAEIEQLAASAAGLEPARGDKIKVSAVDFIAAGTNFEPIADEGVMTIVAGNAGTFINAGTLVLVSLLVLFLGLRPALKAILALPPPGSPSLALAGHGRADLPEIHGMIAGGNMNAGPAMTQLAGYESDPRLDDLARQVSRSPQDRLAKIVELDPDRAAQVLKQWLKPGEKKLA
jgi:flagellar M-ring protein FliF